MLPNILVLATHGSWYVPWVIRPFLSREFRKDDYRLLKNFSDFATSELIRCVPEEQRISCWFSRAIGDPNRDARAKDVFRDQDFNGICIWGPRIPGALKRYLLRRYHQNYHRLVKTAIAQREKQGDVFVLDLHDTGVYLLNKKGKEKRKEGFPGICLSNYDNQSSTERFLKHLAKLFEKQFGIRPSLNHPYKGGYVTQHYGIGYPKRQIVQVEFSRDLYMDENRQIIYHDKIAEVRSKLCAVLDEISESFK